MSYSPLAIFLYEQVGVVYYLNWELIAFAAGKWLCLWSEKYLAPNNR